MIFVDPGTRDAVANHQDPEGNLSPVGGVFTGKWPTEKNIANTAMDWAGTKWTMLVWPLPDDPTERGSMLAHESFHRIQPDLGLSAGDPSNGHLSETEARIWLQMEWRALSRALIEESARRQEPRGGNDNRLETIRSNLSLSSQASVASFGKYAFPGWTWSPGLTLLRSHHVGR